MITPERFIHYKTEIKEIDDDHYSLFLDSGKIIECLREHKHEEADFLFSKLCTDIEEHFKKEESFMRAIEFKFIDAHIESHNAILRDIRNIKNIAHLSDFQIDSFVLKLDEIIISHIDHMDMQYSYDGKNHLEMIEKYITLEV